MDAVIKQVPWYCLDGWPEKKMLPGPVRAYSQVSVRAHSCEVFVDEGRKNSYSRIHEA